MQTLLRSYEGYIKNGNFFSDGRVIPLPEEHRMVITIFNEPAIKKTQSDEKKRRSDWLKELDRLTELSKDEELIYIPRSQEMRPPHGLTD